MNTRRWLLFAAAALNVVLCVLYWMLVPNGIHAVIQMVALGRWSFAAGICTIAAAFWGAKKSAWRIIDGAALSTLGTVLMADSGFVFVWPPLLSCCW